jgi:hypothetical protein
MLKKYHLERICPLISVDDDDDGGGGAGDTHMAWHDDDKNF